MIWPWDEERKWLEEQGLLEYLKPDVKTQVKGYLAEGGLTHLLECITAGLIHHKPEEPIDFFKKCLAYVKEHPNEKIKWNTFLDEKALLHNLPRIDLSNNLTNFCQIYICNF